MTDNNKSYFVTSKNFHGDNDYLEWLKEIKSRYQAIRNRVVMQSNYGALEFNWLLGRDIVQKGAESRWGSGAVNQLSLDLKAAYPDVKGFSVRNLYYMKEWYEFYMADDEHKREADPKGQLLFFIRIVSECDDRYCRGHHSYYSLQIIQTFPARCSMTTCRCRAPSRYPYQLVDTHTQPLSSSRYSHVKNIAIPLIIKRIAIVFV